MMLKCAYTFKLLLIFLLAIVLSACEDYIQPGQPQIITLMSEHYNRDPREPNSKLMIYVSQKHEGNQFIGGHNGFRAINFKELTPWLKNRLSSINSNTIHCSLNKKTVLFFSIKKLFVTTDYDVLVGTLVLNGKIIVRGKTMQRIYRSDCKQGFFEGGEVGIRNCFNNAFDSIIQNIQNDICKANNN